MLSLRTFTRALPKALPRPMATRAPARTFSALYRSTTMRPALFRIGAISTSRAAFSSGAVRMQETSEGSTDQELSATLDSELQLERESTESAGLPAELQEFLNTSGFEVLDASGNEDVVLTKSFGNETIKVSFSVADLATEHDPDAFLQDRALGDEPYDELDGDKKAINAGREDEFATAPEDSAAPADHQATDVVDPEAPSATSGSDDAGFPVTMNITIEKAGQAGALHFSVAAHDGAIGIERFHYFADKSHADAPTAETQWGARNAYTGPPFGNLDEGLQEVLERYLEERGVDTQLALWVPEYIEHKEQREYMGWLEQTKAFVDA